MRESSVLLVDMAAVCRNTACLKAHIGERRLFAVIKGDGYGAGLVEVARAAIAGGASDLVVADLAEARRIRNAHIGLPLLCLAGFPERGEQLNDVAYVVRSERDLLTLVDLGGGEAHLEIDTGMGRGGILAAATSSFAALSQTLPRVRLTGVFSHLKDAASPQTSRLQLEAFEGAIEPLLEGGPLTRHISNTAGLMLGPKFHLDGVRMGLGLFGMVDRATAEALSLSLAVTWRARLDHVYERSAGDSIGYGVGARLLRNTRLGLLSLGYSSGYPRLSAGVVYVRGAACPIVGGVNMTSTVVDLSAAPHAREGDQAVLISPAGPDVQELLECSLPPQTPNGFMCAPSRITQIITRDRA